MITFLKRLFTRPMSKARAVRLSVRWQSLMNAATTLDEREWTPEGAAMREKANAIRDQLAENGWHITEHLGAITLEPDVDWNDRRGAL